MMTSKVLLFERCDYEGKSGVALPRRYPRSFCRTVDESGCEMLSLWRSVLTQ